MMYVCSIFIAIPNPSGSFDEWAGGSKCRTGRVHIIGSLPFFPVLPIPSFCLLPNSHGLTSSATSPNHWIHQTTGSFRKQHCRSCLTPRLSPQDESAGYVKFTFVPASLPFHTLYSRPLRKRGIVSRSRTSS